MDYKQVIVVNKELDMSKGKMAAQVSHASMAFLTRMIQGHTVQKFKNMYPVWEMAWNKDFTSRTKRPQLYKREDLNTWAKEARELGEDCFYAKPVDRNNPYGKLELCEKDYSYETHMIIDKGLYEEWMGGIFTKVILSAKNEAQMKKIVDKAIECGMIENEDFFCIRDACLTELTPDETGTRWTCIGFRPMESDKIDVVTKKLQLFKE